MAPPPRGRFTPTVTAALCNNWIRLKTTIVPLIGPTAPIICHRNLNEFRILPPPADSISRSRNSPALTYPQLPTHCRLRSNCQAFPKYESTRCSPKTSPASPIDLVRLHLGLNGHPELTGAGETYASFRLAPTNGQVFLSWEVKGLWSVIDSNGGSPTALPSDRMGTAWSGPKMSRNKPNWAGICTLDSPFPGPAKPFRCMRPT